MVKQCLPTILVLLDRLVSCQAFGAPTAWVRGPSYMVRRFSAPVFVDAAVRPLLECDKQLVSEK
jgi:hypothetical protein